MTLESVWQATWSALHLQAPAGAFDDLMVRYAGAGRHYHTGFHLQECFDQFELLRGDCHNPGAVMLAIWYHDAVYEPRSHDNEARSAALADAVLEQAGAGRVLRSLVGQLIDVTRHQDTPRRGDEQIISDIDLAILAAPFARFWQYEEEVRAEYAWLDEASWRAGRRKVLASFLTRPAIYSTLHFQQRYEALARQNLESSLARLDEG